MFPKHYTKVILLIVVMVALSVRLIAIYPGHPPNHPDEPFIYDRAADMLIRHSIDPQKMYFYQILPMYFHEAVYGSIFVPTTLVQNLIFHPQDIIRNVSQLDSYVGDSIIKPNALYWGRLVVALLGILSVFLIFLLGKEIYDETTGLIAAFLLTFNYRHFLSSVLSLNDIPNAVATLLTILLIVRELKKPTRRGLLLMGILTGIVFSIKFQPFIFVPVVIALLVRTLQRKNKKTSKRFLIFVKECLLVFGIGALSVAIVNFLPLLHWKEFDSFLVDIGGRNNVGQISLKYYPYWFLYTIGIGPVVSWLAILGLVGSLLNKSTRKYSLVILFYLAWVFFFLSYYSSGGMFVRYFVPGIPLILLFASYIIRIFSIYLTRFIPIPVIFLALGLTISFNFDSMKNTMIGAYNYNKPSTLSCASDWVNNYLPKKSKVGIFPPAPMDALNNKKTNWVYFDHRTDFTLPELQESNIQYVIINQSKYSTYFIRWVMQGTRYWDMPTTIFDNLLPGLVIRELKNDIVYQCVKPWQAPDDNLVIIKVPKTIDSENAKNLPSRTIQLPKYSEWNVFPKDSQLGYKISDGQNCHSKTCKTVAATKAGSYDFLSSYANYGTPLFFPPRFESPRISVHSGNMYQFNVWVKPLNPIPADRRDGFFRMDFYTTNEEYVERKSTSVFVSKRVLGNDWRKIMINGTASFREKFLTISFQTEYFQNSYVIDTFDLYQTDKLKDMSPIKDIQIDKRTLYPSFIL